MRDDRARNDVMTSVIVGIDNSCGDDVRAETSSTVSSTSSPSLVEVESWRSKSERQEGGESVERQGEGAGDHDDRWRYSIIAHESGYRGVEDKCVAKADGAPSFLKQCSGLFCISYAILVAILGVAFPVKEALSEEWLTSDVVGIFLAYIYGVSAAFFVFLELVLSRSDRGQVSTTEATSPPKYGSPKITPGVSNLLSPTHTVADSLTNSTEGGVLNRACDVIVDDSPTSTPSLPLANGSCGDITIPSHLRHRSVASSSASVIDVESGGRAEIRLEERGKKLHPHTTLYLRLAAIIFGIASMVYDSLVLRDLYSSGGEDSNCWANHLAWPYYFHLLFITTQTFFIFKRPQVNVVVLQPLVRLGFMHVIVTNWCVWIRTLILETLESFVRYQQSSPPENLTAITESSGDQSPAPYQCNDMGSNISHTLAPYLFPCVMEYSLLALATMYAMCAEVKDDVDIPTYRKGSSVTSGASITSASSSVQPYKIEINFHKSHRGLFLGIFVLTGSCLCTILFFTYVEGGSAEDASVSNKAISPLIYQIGDLVLLVLHLLAIALACWQTRHLPLARGEGGRSFNVDDVMLLLAASGLILFSLFKIMPLVDFLSAGSSEADESNPYQAYFSVDEPDAGVNAGGNEGASVTALAALQLAGAILAIVVALAQSCLILSLSDRRAGAIEQVQGDVKQVQEQQDKPGRGTIVFLLLANLAMWILKSFLMKEAELEGKLAEEAYGFLAWQLILHLCVPLLLFFHYHSSACLGKAWGSLYAQQEDS